jgi:hypothetical protein
VSYLPEDKMGIPSKDITIRSREQLEEMMKDTQDARNLQNVKSAYGVERDPDPGFIQERLPEPPFRNYVSPAQQAANIAELGELIRKASKLKSVVKDSGKRQEFESGMVRDTNENKSRPDLVRDGPMFQRWIRQVTLGAFKYKPRNWMQATGEPELLRFLESADRHFNIWFTYRSFGINIEDPENPTTEPLKEDHAAAVFFNINGVEYVKERIDSGA